MKQRGSDPAASLPRGGAETQRSGRGHLTAAGPPDNGDDDPVALLFRLEAAGALWRVVARRGDAVTIALCQCDGGEEVDRIISTDPRLVQFVAGRASSAD